MSIEKIQRLALALLARRDHTKYELAQKLSRKGFAVADIADVLNRLEASELINTPRFTQNYADYRRRRGYGPKRIAIELQSKGVPETLIAEHLEINDNSWLTEIRKIWEKRFKGRAPKDTLEKAKQMRFLYTRGFTQEQIVSLFKEGPGQEPGLGQE